MGAVRVVLRQDLPESFVQEVCNRWKKMMILSVVLSTGLQLLKMILNINQGENTNLANDMMKRAGRIVRYSKSKQMISTCEYEHMMGGWTDRLPADS